ncbi:MAG: HD domain-containing protein [Chloroflexi bacterium]|nr:HD domain-containing protein [Chloroflexota bacterium]
MTWRKHFGQPKANSLVDTDLPRRGADSATNSVESRRQFDEEQTRSAELGSLYGLSRALATVPPDSDAILRLVTRHAVETIHVTLARVLLLENEELVERAVHPRRVLGSKLRIGHRSPLTLFPLCQRLIEQSDPQVVRANELATTEQERNTLFVGVCRTICLIPLRADRRCLGFLLLGEERSEAREPFTPEKVRLARSIGDQTASALRRAELFDELERSFVETVLSLANAVEAKDSYTGDHVQNVAHMALDIGHTLGLSDPELEALRFGAILHDIGKIGIPDAILIKPGPLSPEEWTIMRQHPVIGERILAPIQHLQNAAKIVRHHHERYDGKGYPDGLSGEAIPLGARILTVVDSYCAMVDRRIYKAPRSHEEAIAEIRRCAASQFDPLIVAVFLRRAA